MTEIVNGEEQGQQEIIDGAPNTGVTSTNVNAAGATMNSDFDANTVLAADADDTPAALTVAEQRIVGRITSGSITGLTATQVRTLVNVEDGSTADQTGAEIKSAYEAEDDTNAYTDAEVSKLSGIEDGATKGLVNLFTNSSFGVWSNSTLANVASNLVTNGDFPSGITSWDDNSTGDGSFAHDTDHAEIDANTGTAEMGQTITIVTGKLYQLTFDITENCTSLLVTGGSDAYGNTQHFTQTFTATGNDNTICFEAVGTSLYLEFKNSTNEIVSLDDITLYEVEPACVAADALGPDSWYKDTTLDLQRKHSDGGTITHDGSFYSLMCTPSAANDFAIWPLSAKRTLAEHYQQFAGRNVAFGAWVKTSTASHCFLQLIDSDTTDYDQTSDGSSFHTGGGDWEWLEVTMTVSASTTEFSAAIVFDQSSGVTYVSQPILVFGSSIGEGNYVQPPGEIIYFEANKNLNSYAGLTGLSADTNINLEAETNGATPKGVKAVRCILLASCATLEKQIYLDAVTSPINRGCMIYSQVANNIVANDGWCPCDSNGDIRIVRNDTFNEVYIYVTGVMI
jgi:hypothetical protein